MAVPVQDIHCRLHSCGLPCLLICGLELWLRLLRWREGGGSEWCAGWTSQPAKIEQAVARNLHLNGAELAAQSCGRSVLGYCICASCFRCRLAISACSVCDFSTRKNRGIPAGQLSIERLMEIEDAVAVTYLVRQRERPSRSQTSSLPDTLRFCSSYYDLCHAHGYRNWPAAVILQGGSGDCSSFKH